MPKRKAKELGDEALLDEPRRSSRRVSTPKENAAQETSKPATAPKKSKRVEKGGKEELAEVNGDDKESPKPKSTKSAKSKKATPAPKPDEPSTRRQYWLMKAEPESRLEKGIDIKFSIDDLAAKSEPEPWDGIRAYAARNNLRAMKKGDLAFFYHSSCKIPAIVGIMEIVAEHSPDLSAHDPKAPYYDASSSPNNPKWSVVHVEFRQKLKEPITLKELKGWYAEKGHVLGGMQMLKLGRMSVSKVSEEEWKFLVGEMGRRGDEIKE